MKLPKKLESERDRLAEQSVNRDFLPLLEADGRSRHFRMGFDAASAEYEKIIKELTETLDFYASRKSWKFAGLASDYLDIINGCDLSDEAAEGSKFMCPSGGKAARQALSKLKEFRGEK